MICTCSILTSASGWLCSRNQTLPFVVAERTVLLSTILMDSFNLPWEEQAPTPLLCFKERNLCSNIPLLQRTCAGPMLSVQASFIISPRKLHLWRQLKVGIGITVTLRPCWLLWITLHFTPLQEGTHLEWILWSNSCKFKLVQPPWTAEMLLETRTTSQLWLMEYSWQHLHRYQWSILS